MSRIRASPSLSGAIAPAGLSSERPLNERVAVSLRDAIETGELPVGSLLPSEAVLCAKFDASRFTVREALRKLADLGLIATRRGAGSTVVSSAIKAGYSHYFEDLKEILQYAEDTRLDVLEVRPVQISDEEAQAVDAPFGSIWLKIIGVRRGPPDDVSISYVNVFVHSRFAPLLPDVATAKGAIYALVEARSGEPIAEAVQQISAVAMPAAAAKALGRAIGGAALKFTRRYCDAQGGTMLTSINWHPGERFSYTMRIQRGAWRRGEAGAISPSTGPASRRRNGA